MFAVFGVVGAETNLPRNYSSLKLIMRHLFDAEFNRFALRREAD
ncbi:hypothetical protein [Anaerocaecibacter muris]|nr:hypothetical protein [Anaerocaecibacter muris]